MYALGGMEVYSGVSHNISYTTHQALFTPYIEGFIYKYLPSAGVIFLTQLYNIYLIK
jgi:hypothetical protein